VTFDTRGKVVDREQARSAALDLKSRGVPVIAFVTHLEVLRSSHVEKLEEAASGGPGSLFLILTDPEAPLTPLADRALVAAALRAASYVVPSPDGAGPALEAIEPDRTIHDEEEDRGRTRQLIEHVRSRATR